MTPLDVLQRTDPGTGVDAPVTPAPAPGWLDTANAVIAWVPSQVWATLAVLLVVGSAVAFPLVRRLAYKAGARTAGQTSTTDSRDRALFLAAIIPASLLTVAVLIGSQRGLVAFGRDELHWTSGWEYLVPATLDGVGVAFGFLAFRAIRKSRDPGRAVRVAWGAAIASAVINYAHESNMLGGSKLAGAYLALMSMFVMVMFDELLNQFVEGNAHIVRQNPGFGVRWITWPTNTACAWVAWRNYPATIPEGATATVKLAVEHLDEVRAAKRSIRQQRVADGLPPVAWWTPVVPWVRLRQVDAALAVQRAGREAERTAHLAQRADWETRVNGLVAEIRADADRHAEALAEVTQRASAVEARLVEEAERRASVEAAAAASLASAEERHRASMESATEALRRAEEETQRLRGEVSRRPVEAPRRTSTTRSRRSVEPAVTSRRKTGEELLAERVEAAKEALPLWKLETPSGPEIASALGLKSDGVISDIRKQLTADRLALPASTRTSTEER